MNADVIYVAALTYQRPQLLRQLLEAFLELDLPQTGIRFLVIDNDPAAGARATVAPFKPRFVEAALDYVVEPEAGIPAARNRALDEAIAGGGTLLCFTDDDARPDREWLSALVSCQRENRAAMTFGPVRYVSRAPVSGWWRKCLAASITARGRFMERYAAREAGRGRVIGGSGNSMIDLDWAGRHEIRFDTTMRESGGEDTAFREAVHASGGRLAWCERAIVYESLHPERISLRYQFWRARAHGMTFERYTRHRHKRVPGNPVGRMFAGIGLMIVPMLGAASFMLGLHLFGMGIGMLQARHGRQSGLYARR